MRLRLLVTIALLAAMPACNSGQAEILPVIDEPPPRAAGLDPEPPAAAALSVDGISAQDLLRRSEAATRSLEAATFELREFSGGHQTDLRIGEVFPQQYSSRPDRPAGDVFVLRRIVDRAAGGVEEGSPLTTTEMGATRASDARIIGTTQLDDREAWVIWYRFKHASVEGPFEVWRFEWIAQDDFTLLRQVSDWFDPWGPSGWRFDLTVAPTSER